MSTVKIPPVLRPSTGGEREVDAQGGNVGEVLRSLAEQHPETEHQLFGDDGSLNRYVNVYLNDEDVRVLQGLDTPVEQGDTLVILPAMAGGSRGANGGAPAPGCAAPRSFAEGCPRVARRAPTSGYSF
jgi:sulfur-carrier protein